MSRIGRNPITVPASVNVDVAEGVVTPGRGRGGSVSLGSSVEAEAEEPAPG